MYNNRNIPIAVVHVYGTYVYAHNNNSVRLAIFLFFFIFYTGKNLVKTYCGVPNSKPN